MKRILLGLSIAFCLYACGEGNKSSETAVNDSIENDSITKNKPIASETLTAEPAETQYGYEVVVPDLQIAWGIDFLPDGSMLITEKSGELIHFKDGKKLQVKGAPKVYNRGQGGFLDVAVHPEYESNGWIYFTYSASENEDKGGNTALMRAKLENGQLVQKEDLYKATPNSTRGYHFGSRISFLNNHLYFSVGDRGNRDENPQDITRDGGKIYRLNHDGSIPGDNPFVGQENAKEAVFSYGHRNPQGMTVNPETNEIWAHEHGPQGGDEINVIKKGKNYGWPVVSYGINYDNSIFTEETWGPDFEDPIFYWKPSIAPSGLVYVTSDKYPELQGNLLAGSLKFMYVELLELDGKKVVKREKLLEGVGRVRDIVQGPDGFIYVSLEGVGIVRLTKGEKSNAANNNVSNDSSNKGDEEYIVADNTTREDQDQKSESYKRGKDVYNDFCVTCHLATGEGVSGAFPPLDGSDWLTEKRTESIRAVKHGLKGPITVNGIEYNSVMADLGLTDKEVADVMNYINNSWSNSIKKPVTEEEVAKIEN